MLPLARTPGASAAGGKSRRDVLIKVPLLALVAPLLSPAASSAAMARCPGLNGYLLSKCLKEARLAREAAEAAAETADGGVSSTATGTAEDARMKYKQYDQPGTLVTLPSGLQYREITTGSGREAVLGATCEVQYIVYRLAPGAYFKYSSGGTPVLLYALGFGFEGQRDEGEVYRFRLGDPMALPAAATPSVVGMREGGTRRILVPPRLGWVSDKVGPKPGTFGGQRRLIGHREEPLLLEVVMVRAQPPAPGLEAGQTGESGELRDTPQTGTPYRLPMPPKA